MLVAGGALDVAFAVVPTSLASSREGMPVPLSVTITLKEGYEGVDGGEVQKVLNQVKVGLDGVLYIVY